ncbi:4-hydroxyphenylacetate 3-hydroxylase N-terminal domain-containing protein [Streptomyces ipomoeae]|uniref:4-hydroxyphenylacetate 3-hydroxylase N-terminal domain-containing protein n=1 Tax=Streptomyces ipomoeae TaxID=103232 RepID=UPI001146E39C|nr:4-hydroxyphenylacetate 3-hydroxylase N-terminal domain-containing protein [Streptomyces ipomoeae]MDX2937750.1 4-hydroxyphenylacetate 3-hydroxylase N-terminal domain-containing protein [Streptomyces ipomoeae]TQE17243.1 gamma-aminobutyrate dehydratase [Streptomyces ipomoeae]
MTLRTAKEYREGLRDGRSVFYRGRRLTDVLQDAELSSAVDRSAICYSISESHPELAVAQGPGGEYSAFYKVPRTAEELRARGELIETASNLGGGMIVLKEVGSDALFALLRTLDGVDLEKAQAYHQWVCDNDVALAVAQTDVKGDRSLPPHLQADPDLYLHVVDEDEESITVRGAKCHTSFSANADELVVLPTRAMGPEDRDYALSFAIPVDTPGVHLYVSPYLAGERNDFEFPLSSKYKMLESLTVFDNVRVPKDRVFLDRRPELAGPLAIAFVDYHRFTAINYKLPLLDILVGAASLIAEYNGISRAGHVRDKIAQLIAYAETVRGLAELAALRSRPGQHGIQQPDPLAVNTAKYTFAHGFQDAVAKLTDLAGGLLITGPGGEDWADSGIRAVLEKYYAAAVPAEPRLRMLNLIGDLTARDYGGYQAVLATHAEGSLEAEKLQIARSYDASRARDYVTRLAGLS